MATEQQVIDRVRRLVADYSATQRYINSYYQDAIQFALEKLSYDFDVSYSVVSDVPTKHVFLLVKLTTINMCYLRASEGAEGESGEGDNTRYTTIAVPDLTVTDGNDASSRGPAYWLSLADRLQREYDSELGDGGAASQNVGGIIEVGFFRKISLRHGGYTKRKLDPGLSAITVVDPPSVSGSDVTLEWEKLQVEGFSYYEIVRSPTAVFDTETEVLLQQESDIHIESYTETNVPVGTWYYMVRTVNPNLIKTDSNVVSVTVT